MNNQILFIQFLHPGAEHTPNKNNNFISWNTGKHQRKFIKNPGQYLENNCPKNSDLVFWGEWEPQSEVLQRFNPSNSIYPKYLYQPYYSIPSNKQGLQNTDPFIFGNQFHYVCCQQARETGFTQLRFLEKGSVILFGSCLNRKFVLDTVFVVESWQEIESFEQVKSCVCPIYQNVTLARIFNNSCSQKSEDNCFKNISYRLYFGATYKKPVNEMFSFFPCLPYQKNITNGFPRPIIQIKNVIIYNKTQGFKYNHPNYPKNIQTNQKLWEEVRKQVENANLKLGIYTDLPQHKQFTSH